MSELFHTFLVDPLFNALVFLYDTIPGSDVGVAIVLLTLLIKLALHPLSMKSLRAQKELQELQPKIDKIREKHKDDKEKQSQELMKVYSKNQVNPLSSCFPLLIQFPILIGLYRMFISGFNSEALERLYPFVPNPGMLDPITFGGLNLAEAFLPLAVVAGLLQFAQARMMQARRKKEDDGKDTKPAKKDDKLDQMSIANSVSKQLMYVMPVVTVVIASGLPAALALYWTVSTLFAIGQQWFIMRTTGSKK